MFNLKLSNSMSPTPCCDYVWFLRFNSNKTPPSSPCHKAIRAHPFLLTDGSLKDATSVAVSLA